MGLVKFCKNIFKKSEKNDVKVESKQDLKINSGFFTKIKGVFSSKKIDEDKLSELHKLFIEADFGNKLSDDLCQKVSAFYKKKQPTEEEMQDFIKNEIRAILESIPAQIEFSAQPAVILMCGVNGNGKTSMIGKLANKYKKERKKVLLAACDTFRAAAVHQLQEWSRQVDVEIVTGKEKSDPASIAFQACAKAVAEDYDVLFIDTAGRLHNKKDLMNELQKIKKIINKFQDKIQLKTMLVVDANVGHNSDSQFEIFHDAIGIDGLMFTKLDGTTKGGSITRIAHQHDVKVFALSFGEGMDDVDELKIDFLLEKILN